jgi:hypothetical protein
MIEEVPERKMSPDPGHRMDIMRENPQTSIITDPVTLIMEETTGHIMTTEDIHLTELRHHHLRIPVFMEVWNGHELDSWEIVSNFCHCHCYLILFLTSYRLQQYTANNVFSFN